MTAVGDRFVVHMDRESLNDLPMGKYDVTVIITRFTPDTEIEWTISGTVQPPIEHLWGYQLAPHEQGTLVTSYYDWSRIHPRYRGAVNFPILPEAGLRRLSASWPAQWRSIDAFVGLGALGVSTSRHGDEPDVA